MIHRLFILVALFAGFEVIAFVDYVIPIESGERIPPSPEVKCLLLILINLGHFIEQWPKSVLSMDLV